MREVPRHIAVLFLAAAGGVLFVLGAVIDRAAGHIALAVYLGLLLAPVPIAIRSARRRAARRGAGRSCTCCTATVHDPVRVI